MPAPIVTYEGYSGLMLSLLNGISGGANGCQARLFGNNFFPVKSSVWSDFVPAAMAGGENVPLNMANDSGLNVFGVDVWTFSPSTWVNLGAANVIAWGYWIDWTNPRTGLRQSLWAQRFNAPFVFHAPFSSLTLVVTPGFAQGPV